MITLSSILEASRETLRAQCDSRLEGMRSTRYSWWAHWAQLAEVYLPRRYRWFISPNTYNKGSPINGNIVDETGVLAARTLASGMMAGMTSPTRPWFRLGLHDLGDLDFGPVKNWLADCERRMLRVMAESNFYQSLATFYHDLAVFGSASMIVYEDPEQVIRSYNPALGEFFNAAGGRLSIDTQAREFPLTLTQAVDTFGLDALEESDRQLYRQGGTARETEIIIRHIIEPNGEIWQDGTKPLGTLVSKSFPFREVYWKQGSTSGHLLQVSGYREKPFVAGRWDVTSNDPYGRSPGMDGLPAVRQLQIEQRRKAEAIDKMVRPPMVASVSMKNEPMSILPGAINYVADVVGSGFKPAYSVEPRIAEMMEDIKEVQDRVNRVFFVDLFLMISSLDTVRTATEIDARREEKLIQLGPVVERFENEVLDVLIDRIFAIMARRGLFAPSPPEIAGRTVDVEYISMLAEAQRAASTAGIERVFQIVGNLAGIVPEALDTIDWDKGIDIYADRLNVEPEIIRSTAQTAAIRTAKAQQAQQEKLAALTLPATQAAKNLSETDVGGGQNALARMLQ